MPFISLKFDDDDKAMLDAVVAKYKCSQIQAIRLGLLLLHTNPLLQVELPPRHKPGPKPRTHEKQD